MPVNSPLKFEAFLERYASDISRISRASKGEWRVDDIRNEAWLLAFDMGERRGRALDMGHEEDASLLICHLYNHCVKYTELVVRKAQRLDHADPGDEERERHWLADRLVADGGAHPLSLLEAMECMAEEQEAPDPYHSAASGWAWLMRRFGQCMADVANFLLISPSWCYACFRKARQSADTQWPLPHSLATGDDEDAIRPWRKFKLPSDRMNTPEQMSLDYWNRPPQPARGQLWLL